MTPARRSWRRVASGAIIFALQGPRRPYWLSPVLMVAGFVVVYADLFGGPHPAVGLPLLGLGLFWFLSRRLQYLHFRQVARTADPATCLRCGYPLQGLQTDTCPECGVSQAQERRTAQRAAGLHDSAPTPPTNEASPDPVNPRRDP